MHIVRDKMHYYHRLERVLSKPLEKMMLPRNQQPHFYLYVIIQDSHPLANDFVQSTDHHDHQET